MFSILNSLKSLFLPTPPPTPDLDCIISHFSKAVDTFGLSSAPDPEEASVPTTGCFYKTGTVTSIASESLLIDDVYFCDPTNCDVPNLQLGTKVHYLAYQKSPKDEIKVRRILSVYDNAWDSFVEETQAPVVQNQLMKKAIVAKVIRREGRLVFLDPLNITINLDSIDSTFVPYVGDWVRVECFVEVDEQSPDLGGVVLEVEKLQPLRSNLKIGIVSHFDARTGTGGVELDTIFSKVSCQPGYIPSVGDKVVCDCIESDQGKYTWRCLSVVPLHIRNICDASEEKRDLKALEDHDLLMKEKNGVRVTEDLGLFLEVGEEKTLEVFVRNSGASPQVFYRGIFMSKKSQSQLTLLSPEIDQTQTINPSQSLKFVFKVKAKFVGFTEELFIFSFRGFKIGRTFKITVNAKMPAGSSEIIGGSRRGKFIVRGDDCDQENYVPGVRPYKPPNFMAVKQRTFKVPRRLWDVILSIVNERTPQREAEVSLAEEIPCLNEGLTIDNYRDRFHSLLYLEEISLSIDMQKYDMESAILRASDEFLALEVPGLSEKRPSLMIGDKAVVSFRWDSSRGTYQYEGFIHKVTSCEVFMKFNQRFHDDYQGEDCQVTFKSSYSSISKCHNAVDLAVGNLTREILFPTCVKEKEPQIILEEIGTGGEEGRRGERNLMGKVEEQSLGDKNIIEEGKGKIEVDEELGKGRLSQLNKNIVANQDEKTVQGLSSTSLNNEKLQITLGKIKVEPEAENSSQNDSNKCNENPQRISKIQLTPPPTPPYDQETETIPSIKSKLPTKPLDLPPDKSLKRRKLVWFNKFLNTHQQIAVKNILLGTARPLPYVIFGPPGTGKTITLCETILQILTTLPQSRLLIATPSNSSANLISERLLDSGALKPGDLVRLIAHHCLQDDSIPERLLPYCATGNLASESSVGRSRHYGEGPKVNCTTSVLGRHRITIGTCIALGQLYHMGFPRGHFSHILVDEAGQATEPEILVPLTLIEAHQGQIILAGDPMQLGPVVNSRFASSFGLGESFLVRLLQQFPYQRDPEGFARGYDPRLVTKLVINYRSLPEILQLPNSLFYDSELEASLSAVDSEEAQLLETLREELPERTPRKPPAIVFHGVNGEDKQDPDSPSWYNPAEATQVYLYLLRLYGAGLTGEDVGVIAPYQKQVKRIRELLMELEVAVPKVGSVEEFQGQERKVVILSAVRSGGDFVGDDVKHALGFVASPRRLNVAITRARALLIIVGNPVLLQGDPYWRSVIMYCVRNDSYTGCNFVKWQEEGGEGNDLDENVGGD
ncbi:probable RNA helicase armi [Diachasma alloeum]|uniref:probable RNA helicase armi n=1 Tax=Diachasma alloeum TaxID=454923 RepID=UPI0007383321|nr:probable RNA helicase armi [Diachasma alloeum]XP_015114637.1 probable RNA helicase armi [Diachasma alloeum]